MNRRLLAVIILLTVAACRTETETVDATADSTAATSEIVTSSEDGTGESDTLEAAYVSSLDPEGLRLVEPSSGSTRVLAFGREEDDVIEIVTSLQRGPAERSANSECGGGPLTFATWPDGLSLNFSEGRFSGWSVDDRKAGAEQHTTLTGIGVGSTRAELEEAYDLHVEETSIGTEFSAGELQGVLDGLGSTAVVTHMWSGTSCIFR